MAAAVEVRHREPGTAQDKRKDGRFAGRVRLSIAADRSADSLCGFVGSAVMPGSLIVTDDWSGYRPSLARTGAAIGGMLLAVIAVGALGTGLLLARRKAAGTGPRGAHSGR